MLQDIQQECAALAGTAFRDCFVRGMEKAGASPPAVAFTRRLGGAILRDFRRIGPVDVAYVYYPFRANQNQGALLVNGAPALIDVDDQQLLAKNELEKHPAYTALAKRSNEVTLWPGERSGTGYPTVERLPDGGVQFLVGYRLRDVCHACAILGEAQFAFIFDRAGQFLGTKLVRVIGAPR